MLFELFDKDGNLPKKMKKQKEDDDEWQIKKKKNIK
jgi:hypothetical protein